MQGEPPPVAGGSPFAGAWQDPQAAQVGPAAQLSDQDARLWSLFAHLGALSGLFFPILGNIGVPLVIWVLMRERSSFVEHHGKESLNFQISISIVLTGFTIAMVLGVIGTMFLVGLLVMPFVMIGAFAVIAVTLAFVVLAAVRAQEGVWYRYPLSLRFIR